jgi:hypothetical protein
MLMPNEGRCWDNASLHHDIGKYWELEHVHGCTELISWIAGRYLHALKQSYSGDGVRMVRAAT